MIDSLGITVVIFVLVVGVLNGLAALTSIAAHYLQLRQPADCRLSHILSHNQLIRDRFVSVHVATHNEPPALVIQTLHALSELDYSNFEVIVIDNNTQDSSVWRPVAAACRQLGDRFRFYHEEGMVGAKAGALNFALRQANARTEFVAVVDADYLVAPNFLKSAVECCRDGVDFVQFPQAYRSTRGAEPVARELDDYFKVFPSAANEAGASLLTGTLSVISASVLRRVGGWPTRSITEDAELGVMLWQSGVRGLFFDRVVGHGLLPLDLAGLRMQRHRWVVGNTQTLARLLVKPTRWNDVPGIIAVTAQLTAWTGFLAVPLMMLAIVAAVSAFSPDFVHRHGDLISAVQTVAAATMISAFLSTVLRVVGHKQAGVLAVTASMLWTSSFAWLPLLFGNRPIFRRTPKQSEAKKLGFSIDGVGCASALALGLFYLVQFQTIIGVVLIISASGLVTAPFVNRALTTASGARRTIA